MRTNMEDNKIYDPIFAMGTKWGVYRQTLGAALTIDRDSPTLISLDPGGSTRVITLPAVERGLYFIIANCADAAEDLTISSPVDLAGAANVTTRGTISQDEIGVAVSDGVTWHVGVMKQT